MPAQTPAIALTGGWKAFGHVIALRDASLRVDGGEVLAVVGDNGAGKSTLLKVLSGVCRLDRGDLAVGGRPMGRADPRRARQMGISAVFQDLALVETLDVATNMYLGNPLVRGRYLCDRRAMIRGAADALQRLKVRVPSVRVPIGQLSGGQRQGVAIARAILSDNPIVLLDEPTAALGVRETAEIGEMIRALRASGKAVVLVSHDLEFVFQHADRVQVMRLGSVRAARRAADTSREEIIGFITGVLGGESPGGRTEVLS